MAGGVNVSTGDRQPDRTEMLKAFDETKAGVKGLLDSGLLKLPEIFARSSEELAEEMTYKRTRIQVPVIDLGGILEDADRRKQTVEQLSIAAETWGFFQVTNHGIPQTVLDGMIDGIQKFNEQDIEEKKKYYTRDMTARVKYNTNHFLYITSSHATWRDSLNILFPDQICPQELPASCRDSTMEYSKHVKTVSNTLFELLSEALGLKPDHLYNMGCSKGYRITCHYYPSCPQPELTLGTTKHTDPGFITILLQNQITGLQVFYQGQWVDVDPTPGGLVINIGDLLQLVSNGKFKSNTHRVISNSVGPRISVPFFFSGPINEVKYYSPIKELISEENPAKYREILLSDYLLRFLNTGLDVTLGLDYYKL